MSHLSVIIPLPSSFAAYSSLLKTVDCQWLSGVNLSLRLRNIGLCTDRALLEEIDYELMRLRWSPFSCVLKHVAFQSCNEGYRLGLTVTSSPALLSLFQKVNFALHRAGLEIPRKKLSTFIELGFMPPGHEMLLKNWINQHSLLPIPSFDVDRIALIEDHGNKTYGQVRKLEEYTFNSKRTAESVQENWTELTDFNSRFKR